MWRGGVKMGGEDGSGGRGVKGGAEEGWWWGLICEYKNVIKSWW